MKSALNILLVTALVAPLLLLTGCSSSGRTAGDKMGESYSAQ